MQELRTTVALHKRMVAPGKKLDDAIQQLNIKPATTEELSMLAELVLTRNDTVAAGVCLDLMPKVLAKLRALEKLIDSKLLGSV